MSGFSPEWLRLREPLDAASRDPDLCAALRAHGASLSSIVDLGAGTGANMRYLAPLLGAAQDWQLLDDDAAVLAAVCGELTRWAGLRSARVERRADELVVSGADLTCRVRCRRVDLASRLNEISIPDRALVTSSALLDLVSATWLRTLAARCQAARADVLFALTYDGRVACTPAEPEDASVLALFNRHQLSDKGFGPALGPAAAAASARIFADAGYRVQTRHSDWSLSPREQALQAALVDGWLGAALQIAPHRQPELESWHRRRREHVERGRCALTIGHVDLVGRLTSELPRAKG